MRYELYTRFSLRILTKRGRPILDALFINLYLFKRDYLPVIFFSNTAGASLSSKCLYQNI